MHAPKSPQHTYINRALPAGYVARKERNLTRGRLASAKCTGTAMERAFAAIDATFSEAAIHNRVKYSVERAIADGEWSIPNRCRYAKIVFDIADPNDLALTIRRVEALYRHKQRVNENWSRRRNAMEDQILESRLFLRWLRRFGFAGQFPAIVDALTTGPQHPTPLSVLIMEAV